MSPSDASLDFQRPRAVDIDRDIASERADATDFPAPPRFDGMMLALAAAFVGGLFVDGWAHRHGRVDNTFFTPWHAVLYGGWMASFLALTATFVKNVVRGRWWRSALPDGYGLSLVGVMLWFIGGPADLAWHKLFGFEADVEALLSPSHFILALGLGLVVTGPLRSVWAHGSGPAISWARRMVPPLSLTLLLSLITFFTLMGHPMASMPGSAVRSPIFRSLPAMVGMSFQAMNVIALLYWTMLLMGFVLVLLGRGRAPVGALTVMIGVNAIGMGFVYPGERGPYPLAPVLTFVLVGVVADFLYMAIEPLPSRPRAWRRFAFLLPAVLTLAYFIAVKLTYGLSWTIHLWLGSVIFCGVIGLLMSYLVVPWRPALPTVRAREF